MTAMPIDDNFGHWWLTTHEAWNRLHAVPAGTPGNDPGVGVAG